MAELDAKLFRDYFGGSWLGRMKRDGVYLRDIVFNWPRAFEVFSAIGTEEHLMVPEGTGFYDDSRSVIVSGWRHDLNRWSISWYNEYGGYGEMHWTSCELLDGKHVLYGYGHECKQETDETTDHIIKCEMIDQDHFKYTLQSFKKGRIEIRAERTRTAEQLKEQMRAVRVGTPRVVPLQDSSCQ